MRNGPRNIWINLHSGTWSDYSIRERPDSRIWRKMAAPDPPNMHRAWRMISGPARPTLSRPQPGPGQNLLSFPPIPLSQNELPHNLLDSSRPAVKTNACSVRKFCKTNVKIRLGELFLLISFCKRIFKAVVPNVTFLSWHNEKQCHVVDYISCYWTCISPIVACCLGTGCQG